MNQPETFESWAIVELMGHRRIAGFVTSPGGPGALANMMRVDIHEMVDGNGEDKVTTQWYGPSALYCLTAATEEVARRVAQGFHRPIGIYQPALPPSSEPDFDDDSEPDGMEL